MKTTPKVQWKRRLEGLKDKMREVSSAIFGRSTPKAAKKGPTGGRAGKTSGK